jgi:Zn finger protein HypA/HybF involved in hydrogenase expression
LHELSLVEGIIEAVQETARDRGGRVKSFKVRVGELAQFDIRRIRELLVELKKGTQLEQARAVVVRERSRVRCLSCNSEWNFDDLVGPLQRNEKEMVHFLPELLSSYSKCPSCSKSYLEIEEGRSVRLAEVELDV